MPAWPSLEDGRYQATIRQRFADKQGVQSPFVFWGTLTQELLELALDCMPAAHLRILFARLLLDLKANRTGFPDLVRFWPLRSDAGSRYEPGGSQGAGRQVAGQPDSLAGLLLGAGHSRARLPCAVA